MLGLYVMCCLQRDMCMCSSFCFFAVTFVHVVGYASDLWVLDRLS